MLSVLLYDGKNEEAGVLVDFTTDGFKALIDTGVFKTSHCNTDDGKRAIDLKIFRLKVEMCITDAGLKDPPFSTLVNQLKNHRYLVGSP